MKTSIIASVILISSLLASCNRPLRQNASPASSAQQAGNHTLSITVDGLERTYILHTPPNSGEPLPLIVVLHGTYGTGRKMQVGLGFDPYADARGFYVAYPDAYQNSSTLQTARWNDGRGTLESSYTGIDDVKFLVSMVDDIASRVQLDRSRVYVTGASNGGMMTYRLGCETRGVFAGFAPVIGNVPEPIFDACNPSASIKFLAINGDADPFVPFNGGEVCANTSRRLCEGGWVKSQPESLSKFAAANGCDLAAQSTTLPTLVDDGTFIEVQTYPNCAGAAQVKAYVIRNGGHTWPPRESQVRAGGQATGNLDATKVIVEFFLPDNQP